MLKNKKANIASLIFLILINILIFNTLDDPLDPDIEPFLSLSEPIKPTDAHAVLYALDASLETDVIAFGHQLINEYQLNKDSMIFDFENPIEISNENSCQSDVEKCVNDIKNGTRQISKLTDTDTELKKRVQFIKTHGLSGEIFEPNINSPSPKLRYMFYVQGITFQQLINDYLEGDKQQPLEYLYNDTQVLLKLHNHANTILLSMVTTHLIHNNLDLIKELSTNNSFAHRIPELTHMDIAMRSGYSHEFRFSSNIIYDFISGKIENSFFFEKETILDISARRAFIKSNQTINTLYDVFQNYMWLEGDSFSEFIEKTQTAKSIKIDNIIGDILANTNNSSYLIYTLENLQLACNITKYNTSIDPDYQATRLLNKDECNTINSKLQLQKSEEKS